MPHAGSPPARARRAVDSEARLRALLEISRTLSASLELDVVLERFAARAAELTGAVSANLFLWRRDRDALVSVLDRDADDELEIEIEGRPALRRVLERGETVALGGAELEAGGGEGLAGEEVVSLLLVPLVSRGETLGLIAIGDRRDRAFAPDEIEFADALSAIVAGAVHNATLYESMRELALRDPLTGLLNRHSFGEALAAAVARARRSREPLSLIVLDLDGLKTINDRDGHHAGDEALRRAADALRASVRAGDLACRLGGDEFAAILPGATDAEALAVAERAQRELALRAPGCSFSGGVAPVERALSADDLHRRADLAALQAKARGGARTLAWPAA